MNVDQKIHVSIYEHIILVYICMKKPIIKNSHMDFTIYHFPAATEAEH